MTDFNKIVEVNKTIGTTKIKGKDYAEVNQRVKAFRMLYPDGVIETEIVSLADGMCIIKAHIKDADGKLLATGTAYEKEGSSNINRTSYIENCETSAIGRALGFCGIGIDTSIASYEEVATSIMQQEEKPTEVRVTGGYSEKRPPIAPKGYKLVETKTTKYGYLYFKYVAIPEKDPRRRAKKDRDKAG
jgi:hypothetical protein